MWISGTVCLGKWASFFWTKQERWKIPHTSWKYSLEKIHIVRCQLTCLETRQIINSFWYLYYIYTSNIILVLTIFQLTFHTDSQVITTPFLYSEFLSLSRILPNILRLVFAIEAEIYLMKYNSSFFTYSKLETFSYKAAELFVIIPY